MVLVEIECYSEESSLSVIFLTDKINIKHNVEIYCIIIWYMFLCYFYSEILMNKKTFQVASHVAQ